MKGGRREWQALGGHGKDLGFYPKGYEGPVGRVCRERQNRISILEK